MSSKTKPTQCSGCSASTDPAMLYEKQGAFYCNDCANSHFCSGCNKPVLSFISALGKHWHDQCFKCAGCNHAFSSMPSSEVYVKDEKPFCGRCKKSGFY